MFVISVISDGVEFMPAVIAFMHSDYVLLFVCLESVESGRGVRTFKLKVQIVQFLIFFSLWIGNIWILFIAFVSSFNCYTCLADSIVCESKSTSKSFPITSTTNSRQQPPGCAIRQKKPTFFLCIHRLHTIQPEIGKQLQLVPSDPDLRQRISESKKGTVLTNTTVCSSRSSRIQSCLSKLECLGRCIIHKDHQVHRVNSWVLYWVDFGAGKSSLNV